MKVWRLFDGDTPVRDLLSPEEASAGREGYGVYEVLDQGGALLYTGRTKGLATRLRQHALNSKFWHNAAEVRWTPCTDYAAAVSLERVSIIADKAPANIVGKTPLPTNGRQHLPSATAGRLRALYATSDQGRWERYDFATFVATLRHVGWTLQSIGDELRVTREGIRQHVLRGAVDLDLCVPVPPIRTEVSGKVWPQLRPGEAEELAALFAVGKNCRGNSAADHPARLASIELSRRLAQARDRGVRVNELAAAVGVQPITIYMRLARHGYISTPPSVTPFGRGREVVAS
jgi:hypothetical protein